MKPITSLAAAILVLGAASACTSSSSADPAATSGGDAVTADTAGATDAAGATDTAVTADAGADDAATPNDGVAAEVTPLADTDSALDATPGDVTTPVDTDGPPPTCPGAPPTSYVCPGGASVPLCTCGPDGYTCDAHPERGCPTLCDTGETVDYPCSDGSKVPWCTCKTASCAPVCNPAGAEGAGWYDSCSNALVKAGQCTPACPAVCTAIGSKSEGWSDACTSDLITWAQCAPKRECGADPGASCPSPMCYVTDTVDFTCPEGGKAPFCMCMSAAADCKPKCKAVGSEGEGWYDGCTDKVVKLEKCEGCTSSCGAIGSKSEGWYSSCSGLLGWVQCATGIWTCEEAPWDGCAAVGWYGALCTVDTDCTSPLACLKGEALTGVCSRVCTPATSDCDAGTVCSPLPNFQAPGFCLTPCSGPSDCESPLTCGTDAAMPGPSPVCFDWSK